LSKTEEAILLNGSLSLLPVCPGNPKCQPCRRFVAPLRGIVFYHIDGRAMRRFERVMRLATAVFGAEGHVAFYICGHKPVVCRDRPYRVRRPLRVKW
jgi:hypothetical protein